MPSMVEEDQVTEYLSKMDIYRLIGPGEVHPRELADMITRPLPIICEKSWQLGNILSNCKVANITCVFKKDKSGQLQQ